MAVLAAAGSRRLNSALRHANEADVHADLVDPEVEGSDDHVTAIQVDNVVAAEIGALCREPHR